MPLPIVLSVPLVIVPPPPLVMVSPPAIRRSTTVNRGAGLEYDSVGRTVGFHPTTQVHTQSMYVDDDHDMNDNRNVVLEHGFSSFADSVGVPTSTPTAATYTLMEHASESFYILRRSLWR